MKKFARLEAEFETLLNVVKNSSGEEEGRCVEAIISNDIRRTQEAISKVKNKKVTKLRRDIPDYEPTSPPEKTTPSPGEVVNMSSRQLTALELSVLSRGLSFVPSRKQTIAQLTAELKEWERLMRLKEYWHDGKPRDDTTTVTDDRSFKNSRWVPPKGRDPWLDLYLEEVTAGVIRETRKRGKGNLSSDEESALLGLIRDDSIVIRPADKGSGIVIMNTQDYLDKLDQEVCDNTTYRPVAEDQTPHIHKQVKKLVSGLHQKGYIGPHQTKYMVPARPQPGQLQGNPKLHKPGAPLRAIISGRGHATEKIAEVAEEQLRRHVEGLSSYVKDTNDFLLKLNAVPQPIENQHGHAPLLFCMDVKKLYPSVPRADGIAACRLALDSRSDPSIPTEEVINMIEMVLDNNNFSLTSDCQFVQTDGTAIGSRLGKNYACTYLGQWEKQLLDGACFTPLIYFRYIDDIFGIWLHGEEKLRQFHERANQIHGRIQVDLRVSPSDIEFLDVIVKLGENGFLTTDLYVKPTDSKSYLHFNSDHPLHTKKAVPFGLGLRMKRICTREEDFRKHRNDLKARLIDRKYPVSLIEQALQKVDKLNRDQLLNGRRVEKNTKAVPMAITFSQYLPNIKAILKNKRHLLQRSNRLSNVFPSDPMVAYKRAKNLKDMLVHSKTRRTTSKRDRQGTENCGKGCVICKRMYAESERVTGAKTKHVTTYDRTIGCRSVNVIYGIWCNVCRCVCYVGETGGCLYARIQNHLSSIRASNPAVVLPVRNHFCAAGHGIDDVRVIGLERVWRQNVEYRRARERRWMNLLGTNSAQGGLNKRHG